MKSTQMSGGMRRRLNLVRALAVEPEALFLDEPFTFLDADWQQRVAVDIAQAAAAGCAVFMVSHQLRALEQLPHRRATVGAAPLQFAEP